MRAVLQMHAAGGCRGAMKPHEGRTVLCNSGRVGAVVRMWMLQYVLYQ